MLIFGAGLALGVIIHPLARMIESQGIDSFLDWLGRFVGYPFSLVGRLIRRIRPSKEDPKEAPAETPPRVDPREQQISDTAQTIRGILLSLATVIQRTDQAASDSSQPLGMPGTPSTGCGCRTTCSRSTPCCSMRSTG
jgi:diguanylate cyclase